MAVLTFNCAKWKCKIDQDLTPATRDEMKNTDKIGSGLAIADNVSRQVCEEKTAISIWKKLEALYLDKSLSSHFYLMLRLFRMRMQEVW